MDSLSRDIKFAFRLLWKDPGFTATAVLTLAVSIAANTAIFTIVNSLLLRPLPLPEADRIVLLSNQYPKAGVGESHNSGVPDYYDRRQAVTVLEEQALFNFTGQTIEIAQVPERVSSMAATPSLFRLLRVPPALGRVLVDEDAQLGSDQKVILSHGMWQRLGGGDPGAKAEDVRISGKPYRVVGVMPRDFVFLDPDVEMWTPLAFTDEQKSDDARHSNSWYHVGRLKPGATREQAQAQVDALNAANLERFPQWKPILLNAGFHTRVEWLKDMLVGSVRRTLYLLWGGAALVLLIAGVNIANLALARSTARLKEIATRLALGAARTDVARQLVTESVLTTWAAGLVGLWLGSLTLRALTAIGLDRLPRASEVQMDGTVFAFTFIVATVAGVLIGLVGVGRLFRLDLSRVLNEEGRSVTFGKTSRVVRRGLVVAQVGFAFVLLIGAGLLFATFQKLLAVDPGFSAEGVITASAHAPRFRYEGDAELRFFMTRMLDAFRAVPGVTAAGATSSIPLGGDYSDSVILAEGYAMQPGESLISPRQVIVSPGYFDAMRIARVRGRDFDERDVETSPGVVIVDERLAKKFWADRDPLGRRMYLPTDPNDLLRTDARTRWLTVVGVVRDVRLEDLAGGGNQAGAYYFPYAQRPTRGATFAIRTASDLGTVLKAARAEIARIDPELPLFDVRTMVERTELSLTSRRAATFLALAFGSVALFLSAVGIYGVLAYVVAQRAREIGIRMALGSSAAGIFELVLREGLLLVGSGVVLGLLGALLLGRAMESQLYGVQPMDPRVVAIVTVVLATVALIASVLPARRATRVDPVVVLGQQ